MLKLFLIYIILLFWIPKSYANKLDSLQKIIYSDAADKNYFDAIIDIASDFNESNPDSSLYYLNMAYDRNPDEYYENLLNLEKAGALQRKGKYSKSTELMTNVLSFFESKQDRKQISTVNGRLGYLYLDMGNTEKAGKYFSRAMENIDELMTFGEQVATLVNYARYLESVGEIDSAQVIRYKLIDWSKANRNYNILSLNYLTIASNYLDKSEYDSTEKYFQYSLDLTDSISEKFKTMIYLNYGRYLGMTGNFQECVNQTRKSINFFKKSEPEGLVSIYTNLSIAFELMSKYDSALHYSKKIQKLTDSLRNVKMLSEIAKIEAVKDNELKDQEIKNLLKEKAINEKLNYSIIIIIVLITILLIFIIRALINQRKNNKRLKSLNQELDAKNKMLVESEENLKELNQTKDKLFSIVAHDLRNPVNSMYRGLEFIRDNQQTLEKTEIDELIDESAISAKNLNTLLENLLSWSQAQRGLIKVNKEKFSVDQLLEINFELFKSAAKSKSINLELVRSNIEVYSDQNLVNNILRNLINNAIKFTQENGTITAKSEKVNESIEISIIDNGLGIPSEKLDKLFDVVQNSSKIGTSGERGTGLGLVLCYEFAKKVGGDLKVESELGKGSKFKLILPF